MAVNGRVYDMTNNFYATIVGKFDTVSIFENNILVETKVCNNAFSYYTSMNTQIYYIEIDNPQIDTIKTVQDYGSQLYFGGTCKQNTSQVCVSRDIEGIIQPLIKGSHFTNYSLNDTMISIEKLRLNEQNKLFLSGKFTSTYSMYTGNSFASYDFFENKVVIENSFYNSTVYDFYFHEGRTYFGTDFNETVNNEYVAFFVRTKGNVSLDGLEKKLSIYPNPSENDLIIRGIQDEATFEILNNIGQTIKKGKISNEKVCISDLSPGSYFLKAGYFEEQLIFPFIKL
jgi:hypothetical protein